MKIQALLNVSEAVDAKARLAQLQADLKDMSVTPHSQEAADAVDEVRAEIKKLKAQIAAGNVSESAYDASSAYANRYTQVNTLLGKINRLVQDHSRAQQGNPESWGHSGDLAYVAEQLEALIEFLSSGKKVSESFGQGNSEFSPQLVRGVYDGSIDIADELNQNTSNGRALARLFDVTAAENRLSPDDQYDEIIDIMTDNLMQKMGGE